MSYDVSLIIMISLLKVLWPLEELCVKKSLRICRSLMSSALLKWLSMGLDSASPFVVSPNWVPSGFFESVSLTAPIVLAIWP